MKKHTILFICIMLFTLSAFAHDTSKDTSDYSRPQSVTYIEFIARFNIVGINYEPILYYDSTVFFGAGARLGLQVGLGTTLPVPFFGVRFDVPVIPVLVIGKEYGLEIGTGIDFQWWLNKTGFASGNETNTYNSVKPTAIIAYRHYYFGFPHHLFRIGFTTTLQANQRLQWTYFVSFGI